jgi:metal-responsive CopG/Arc/MetJ family transcriptional regulator
MQKTNKIAIGISFSESLLKEIDKNRRDISRSRYITKILEKKHHLSKKIKRASKRPKNTEETKNLISNKIDLLEIRPSSKSPMQ